MTTYHTPAVGQEVAVQSGYSYDRYMFGFIVTRITPSGQVIVSRRMEDGTAGPERRFDKDGYEMGSNVSKFRRQSLVTDVAAARESVRNEKARNAAASAINAVRGDAGRYNDKDSLQAQIAKLAGLLDLARLAVEEVR